MGIRVTVIGAGPGGYAAAVRAAQLGAEVTLIERDKVGGTCLNWGCIPSKVMITAAQMLEKSQHAREFGLRFEGTVTPDLHQLMARKDKVIQDQSRGILDLLCRHKICFMQGAGFVGKQGIAVVRPENGDRAEVCWDKLILAPGTQPLEIPAFPFDGRWILSSNDALSLQAVPASIMILGGGVIGCEFAFLLSALGSRVTVVDAMDRLLPLPSVDEACSRVIEREMKKRKIRILLQRTAEAAVPGEGKLRVTLGPSPFATAPKDGESTAVEVDKMLVTVGRKPLTAGMGLEELGVKLDAHGWIEADARMETRVPGVYAIGDALGPTRTMLAHAASAEGRVAAENAAGETVSMDYTVLPGAIFTMPEVANVGLTEVQAREHGIDVRADSVLFRTLGKPQVTGEIAGEAKIVYEARSGRILGVHLVGPHATDLIAEGTLAIKLGATVKDLAETIHAHPTLSEVIQEASCKALGRSLHG